MSNVNQQHLQQENAVEYSKKNLRHQEVIQPFLQRVRIARNAERCTRGILSVCLFVRPSVTFRYCVQMNEDTIVWFSESGRTIPLVSEEVKFIRIFAGDHPQRGR